MKKVSISECLLQRLACLFLQFFNFFPPSKPKHAQTQSTGGLFASVTNSNWRKTDSVLKHSPNGISPELRYLHLSLLSHTGTMARTSCARATDCKASHWFSIEIIHRWLSYGGFDFLTHWGRKRAADMFGGAWSGCENGQTQSDKIAFGFWDDTLLSVTYESLRKALLKEDAGGAHHVVQYIASLHQHTAGILPWLILSLPILLFLQLQRFLAPHLTLQGLTCHPHLEAVKPSHNSLLFFLDEEGKNSPILDYIWL